MVRYGLEDVGYFYKGAATNKSYSLKVNGWNIIDIPEDIPKERVESEISIFLDGIKALEIPTSLMCNLRCKYCYVDDPRMKNKVVPKEVVTRILEEVSKSLPHFDPNKERRENGKDKVHISPWGAEPFMNVSTLEAIYEFCNSAYGKNNYVMGTSTNGTIWSDRIAQLITNIVKDGALNELQISLDGPPEVQNRYRPHTDGKGSFNDIEKFYYNFSHLMGDLKVKDKKHHFCSTIHLQDPEFSKMWAMSAEFFSEPNKWWSSMPSLPMRMSGEDMYGMEEINRFIDAQRLTLEVVKERAKQGITIVDFYTSKLFCSIDCKSKNAFPFCSAMNSQIGIDLDGSMYPCHGAITTPKYKPFMWFGHLFDRTISYTAYKRNIHYQYGSIWNRAKCTSCPIYHFTTGNVCWSCGPHNLAVSGEPSFDNIFKCLAYIESYKYWVAIAKISVNNPILDEIPSAFLSEVVNIDSNRKLDVMRKDMHFDRNYDGLIANAIRKVECCDCPNIEDMYYSDEWWNFDDFIDIVKKES